jgi:hypothetical protein
MTPGRLLVRMRAMLPLDRRYRKRVVSIAGPRIEMAIIPM